MIKVKHLFRLLLIGVIFMTFNSCTEENPVIERTWKEGPTENGDLNVYVRKDVETGAYLASAEVKIYTSVADRDADNYIAFNLTDPDDPINKPAVFKSLDFGYYYIKVKWRESPTDAWRIGTDETWVPKGTTITRHVVAKY